MFKTRITDRRRKQKEVASSQNLPAFFFLLSVDHKVKYTAYRKRNCVYHVGDTTKMKPRNTIINNEFVKTYYLLPTNYNPTPKRLLIKFFRLRMKVNYLHAYIHMKEKEHQTYKN